MSDRRIEFCRRFVSGPLIARRLRSSPIMGTAGVRFPFGGAPDTGGQNVYVNTLAGKLEKLGYKVTIFARGGFPHFESDEMRRGVDYMSPQIRYVYVPGGGETFIRKEDISVALDEQLNWLFQVLSGGSRIQGMPAVGAVRIHQHALLGCGRPCRRPHRAMAQPDRRALSDSSCSAASLRIHVRGNCMTASTGALPENHRTSILGTNADVSRSPRRPIDRAPGSCGGEPLVVRRARSMLPLRTASSIALWRI